MGIQCFKTYHGGDEVQDVWNDEEGVGTETQLVPVEPDFGIARLGQLVLFVHRLQVFSWFRQNETNKNKHNIGQSHVCNCTYSRGCYNVTPF